MSNTSGNDPNATAHTNSGSPQIDPHRSPAESPSRSQRTREPLLGAAGQRRHRRWLAILSLLCLCGVWISLPDRGRQTPRLATTIQASAEATESSSVIAADSAGGSNGQIASPQIAPGPESVGSTISMGSTSDPAPPASGSTTAITQPRTPNPSLGAHAAPTTSPTPNTSLVVRPIPMEFKLPNFEPGLRKANDPEPSWKNPGTKTGYWEPGRPYPFTSGIKPLGSLPHDYNRLPTRSFERRTTGLHPPIRPILPIRGRQGRR